MRKITGLQIVCFSTIFAIVLALAGGGSWWLLRDLPLGRFSGVAIVAVAVLAFYLLSLLAYRLFLAVMPLQLGTLAPGSRAEFAAQVNILFYLMVFNSLVRTHFVPVPLMRLVYLALGARLGRDSYSAGALLDPPLTFIGDRCIVGHDAVVFTHVIEGDRFELHTVRIGHDVTIGAHAVVMPDVEIGDGAIVSVGAVVTKGSRIGPGEIWGGVPARRLSQRPPPKPPIP
ncbi:acyltransferase [Rubrivivax gelatinosus]|uniref:Putative transferase n=1 Tax=Rubrivivax gelatinosus (strain NBRC 100245 / IL144) TaxID=983917 RepID=I0HL25_RUBGI|nr:DapH/DapD/GlmU-related protein [Rubrivivax gelatinosus]BAL93712.1 putative transferase [Rubrivivax gelatinosus IL144]